GVRHRRRDRWHDPGRPGGSNADPCLQCVLRRREGGGSRRLVGAVGGADADRDRADGSAVPLRRAQGAVLMVENRPWLTVLSHAVLLAGVALIAFPLYITFVASTLTHQEILQVR